MSELIDSLIKKLDQWPLVQGFFIIVITFCGFVAMRKGERERRANTQVVELPTYLLTGPVYEALRRIEEIAGEQRQQTQLLEDIRNRLELNERHRDRG